MAGRRSRIKLTPKICPRVADPIKEAEPNLSLKSPEDRNEPPQTIAESITDDHDSNSLGLGPKADSNTVGATTSTERKGRSLSGSKENTNPESISDKTVRENTISPENLHNDISDSDENSQKAGLLGSCQLKKFSLKDGITREDAIILKNYQNRHIRRRKVETVSKFKEWGKEFQEKLKNPSFEERLIMRDLIYHIPPSQPMKSNKVVSNLENEAEAEIVDDVEIPNDDPNACAPVPRVTVGSNGELIIDEQSLVIETTDSYKSKTFNAASNIVHDTGNNDGSYRLKRVYRSKKWTLKETARFYKALSIIGTDFTMMSSIFPGRTRLDLRNKFKNEEKYNSNLIDKALQESFHFDPDALSDESEKGEDEDENDPFFQNPVEPKQRKPGMKLWVSKEQKPPKVPPNAEQIVIKPANKRKRLSKKRTANMEFDVDEPVPVYENLCYPVSSTPTKKKTLNINKQADLKGKSSKKRKKPLPKVKLPPAKHQHQENPEEKEVSSETDVSTSVIGDPIGPVLKELFSKQNLCINSSGQPGIHIDGDLYLVTGPDTGTDEKVIHVFFVDNDSPLDTGGHVICHDATDSPEGLTDIASSHPIEDMDHEDNSIGVGTSNHVESSLDVAEDQLRHEENPTDLTSS